MKKTIRMIAGFAAALTIASGSCITASAKRDTDYTREEIVEKYWTSAWSNSDPGEVNPEGSLDYYILQCFLDEYYGTIDYNVVSDWSSSYQIYDAWNDYYEEYTKYWDFDDNEETGEFTIKKRNPDAETYAEEYTDELLYTFELIDGMWNMIDTNGNSVLVFEPHGGDGSYRALLERERNGDDTEDDESTNQEEAEDEDTNAYESEISRSSFESSSSSGSSDSSNGSRVTGTLAADSSRAEESTAATEAASEIDTEESGSTAPYVIGGIVLAGAAAGGIFVYRKKKHSAK